MAFAKLFGVADEQILVKLDETEDGKPEIRVYFKPPDSGVCSVASVFSDSDDGRKSAKLVFAKIDEASAREMIESVMKWMEEDA